MKLGVGRFKVASRLIFDLGLGPTIYEGIIPLRVEHVAWEGYFDVMGIHEAFDLQKEGELAPYYDVVLEQHTKDVYDPTDCTTKRQTTITRTFKRQE
jgi:hypothetical protein